MELLLIRHALPVRAHGGSMPADPPLAPAGEQQAQRLAAYLADERIDAVYSSPMRRALATAAPVAAHHELQPVVDDRLAEWDRAATEYVPVSELRAAAHPRWQALVAGDWLSDEDPTQFVTRVVTAIESIVAAHPGGVAAAVCHGGVINTYLAHVLGRDGQRPFFAPNYTSIHRIAAARSGERQIMALNEIAHLRGSGLPTGLFDRA